MVCRFGLYGLTLLEIRVCGGQVCWFCFGLVEKEIGRYLGR